MEYAFEWFTEIKGDLIALIGLALVLAVILSNLNNRFRKFLQGIDAINLFLELDEKGKPTKPGRQRMWIFMFGVTLVALTFTSVFFYSFSAQLEFTYFAFFRWFLEFFFIILGLLFFITLFRGVILLLTKKMTMQESVPETKAD